MPLLATATSMNMGLDTPASKRATAIAAAQLAEWMESWTVLQMLQVRVTASKHQLHATLQFRERHHHYYW